MAYQRPTWDEYFFEIVVAVSKRASCDRGRSGCVIVKENQILATGYVGPAAGMAHCDDVGHLIRERINSDGSTSKHCVRTIHAEQNAICQAAKHGIPLKNATLYCTMEPCDVCAKMIVNAGIKVVKCQKRYHRGQESREIFKECSVELIVVEDEVEKYPDAA